MMNSAILQHVTSFGRQLSHLVKVGAQCHEGMAPQPYETLEYDFQAGSAGRVGGEPQPRILSNGEIADATDVKWSCFDEAFHTGFG